MLTGLSIVGTYGIYTIINFSASASWNESARIFARVLRDIYRSVEGWKAVDGGGLFDECVCFYCLFMVVCGRSPETRFLAAGPLRGLYA